MSRPVFEPSLPRMDASLAYGSRQLFRRPAPVAGESGWPEYPYFYLELTTLSGDSPQLVPSGGAGIQVHGYDVENDQGGVYLERGAPDTDYIKIVGAAQGIYRFTAQLHWEDGFTGGTHMRFQSGAWGWYKSFFYEEAGGAASGGSAPIISFESRMPSGVSLVEFQVEQWSGGDQYVESAFFEIAYLGPFVGTPNTY